MQNPPLSIQLASPWAYIMSESGGICKLWFDRFEKTLLSFINEGDSVYIVTQPITENDQCDSHANHMLLPLNRKITK
jgi:hypothetical protein